MRSARALLALAFAASACGPFKPAAKTQTPTGATAGATTPTGAPVAFDRATIRALAETRGYRNGAPTNAVPTADGKAVLFLRSNARDLKQSLYEMDLVTGQTRELLGTDAATKGDDKVPPAERARRERLRIAASGVTSFELTEDGSRVVVSLSGRLFVLTRANNELKELPTGGEAFDPHFSHDGKRVAFVQKNDVMSIGVDGKDLVQVTRGGTDAKAHGMAEFVAQEELDRTRGFWWSPDNQRIAFEEADCTKVEELTIADPSAPERDADKARYPRAGRANCEPRFGIVSARGGAVTWIDLDGKRYPYAATVTWSKGAPLTIYALDRLQRNTALVTVDPQSGRTTTLLEEHDAAWVNVDPSVPRWLPDGSAFLWSSERDGSWRLELRDAKGAVTRTLTAGDFGYRGVIDLDPARKLAVVAGSSDPSSSAVYNVSIDGGAPTVVGRFDKGGIVTAQFGESHDVFVQMEASLQSMPKWYVRTTDGRGRWELPSVAEAPAALPNVQLVTVGPQNVRAAVVRPRAFDAKKKYPVIDAAYGGPGVVTVVHNASGYLRMQWIADATGAIVVAIDARGTPNRGREWERAIAGKLGAVPLEGHVAALQGLAALPEVDVSRIGIYGWSFGGYLAALAALTRPDVFRVAVVGAAPSDWRDYDTCYTERYLGLPSADVAAYDGASLVAAARSPIPPGAAVRPMLVLHGTADDNVYFANTLKLVDALERSGRPFELMPLTGHTHMVTDPHVSELVWVRTAAFLRAQLQ